MTNETRTLIAAFFLMAALLVAMPLAADAAPILEWWVVLVLVVVGALLLISTVFDFTRMTAAGDDTTPSEALPATSTLPVSIPLPASSLPDVAATPSSTLPFETVESAPPDIELDRQPRSRAFEPEPLEQGEEPQSEAGAEVPAAPADPAETVIQEMTAAPVMPGTETAEQIAEVLEESDDVHEQVVEVAEEAADAPPAPTADDQPEASAEPDDLTRIIGIGPKSRDALIAAGIDTYAKLAASDMDTVTLALKRGNVQIIRSAGTWIRQAQFAARGDWDGLNEYVAQTRSIGD